MDWLDSPLLEHLPDPVIVLDLGDLQVVAANARAVEFFGIPRADALGMNVLEIVHPDDLGIAMVSAESIGNKTMGTAIEVRVDTRDGWKLVEAIGSRVQDAECELVILSMRDLTQRRRWEILHDDDARIRAMLHHTATAIFMLDADGAVMSTSAATTRDLGLDAERFQGRSLLDLVHHEDRATLSAALDANRRRQTVEVRLIDHIGQLHPYQLHIVNLGDDPSADGYVVSGQDIAALAAARDQLTFAADHDALTGTLNRAGFIRRLALLLKRPDPELTVAFVDLNDFKPINDTYGHQAGDHTLTVVAGRLLSVIRRNDFVGRLGGDEFAIALQSADQRAVAAITERIAAVVNQSIEIGGAPPLRVRLSLGAAMAQAGDTPEILLHRADQAMYRDKARSKA